MNRLTIKDFPMRLFVFFLVLTFMLNTPWTRIAFADQSKPLPPEQQRQAAQGADSLADKLKAELDQVYAETKTAEKNGDQEAVDDGNEVLGNGVEAMKKIKEFKALAEAGKLTVELAKKFLEELKELLKELKGLLEEIVELLKELLQAIIDLFKDIIDLFKGLFEGSECAYATTGDPSQPGETLFVASGPIESTITVEPEIGLSEDPLVLNITATTSEFTLLSEETGDPEILDLTVLSLESRGSGVYLQPGVFTGENVQTLDPDYPSTGYAVVSTGEIFFELHSQVTNDLFPADNPILVTSDIAGHFDTQTGTLTCTSTESIDFICTNPIHPLPVPGMTNDASVEIPLGFDFELGGIAYSSVYVSDDGYLTFGQGLVDSSPSVQEFLEGPPRIAGVWTDLNPDAGGSVEFISEPERFVVYYNNVPCGAGGEPATFSIAVLSSGGFVVAHSGIPENQGTHPVVSGFSLGGDWTTGDEEEIDLSAVLYSIHILEDDVAVFEEYALGEEIDIPEAYLVEPGADLNGNGIPDLYDIMGTEIGVPGTSLDENHNGIPDECE